MVEIKPIIHLNGTSPEALLEGYREAMAGARKLLEALSEAAPNGRDYYPHPTPGAMEKASREHNARIAVVRAVMQDMEELAQYCADFIDERDDRRSRGR